MSISGRGLDVVLLHFALKDKRFMLELSKAITPVYLDDSVQDFYAVILDNFYSMREILSLPVLLDHCDSNNMSDKRDRFSNIYQAADSVMIDGQAPSESDLRYFINKVKERYNKDVVKDASQNLTNAIIADASTENLNQLFEQTLHEINAINRTEVFDEGSVGEDAENMMREFEQIADHPESHQGVLSGFPSLDNITNGFQGSELIVISGMEGSGKSLLMMNMAINAWRGSNNNDSLSIADDGANIVYFTLEMPRSNKGEITTASYLNKRILSCMSELPLGDIRKGILGETDREKLRRTCDFIRDYDEHKKFYVVDIPRGATVQDIETKYLELKDKIDIDLIVIDYMGIMSGGAGVSDWEAQGHIAAELHELARTYNKPIVTAAQVNRPQGNNHSLNKQNYNTNRVARSAMITQNANIVLQIEVRDEEYLLHNMPIHITKMRDGAKGELTFIKEFANMRVYDSVSSVAPDDNLDQFEVDDD